MATLNDSLVSTSARRLAIRKRPDLTARRQQYLGQSYWVVKEPVGLNYYRFQDEEYAILQMLDGQTSLDEIKERFEAEFPPQKITLEELQQFLGMLHRSGLAIADVQGQGVQLRKRRDERKRKELLGALTNVLCIRFKGFDPERFLTWLYPKVSWFFSRTVVVLSLLFAFSALMLVMVQFNVFRSKLPDFYQFFSPTNALFLAVTLGVAKVFHEFGHGLTCKHFGGECHEMGVMILVLTPCLYCNVSDSWMLPNKWHRAAIGAAGMYIEVVLAAACTYIWWYTEPGLLNNLCLNIIFIASVSTILFNANPLLRYDGYYILADIMEIPNLRQKATSILSRKAGSWFLGLEEDEDPFLPKRNQIFFALYSVAAAIYRWFVMASILYFMYRVFEPIGLQILGNAIIAMSLYGLLVMPLYKMGKFFYVPGRWDKVKKPRMYASITILLLLVFGSLFIPVRHTVICPLEVQARDAAPVYIEIPGILEDILVRPCQEVVAGQPLGRLSNVDVELGITRLRGERNQLKSRLESLRSRRFADPRVTAEIPQVEEELLAMEEQLKRREKDLQRLLLVAPISGTIMPPKETPRQSKPGGPLSGWWGTPLKERNLGAFLDERVLFCQVGDPKKMKASVVIDQSDVEFIREGLRVEIKLDELPHRIFTGVIDRIAPTEMKVSSKSMSTKTGGELPTKTDETGVEVPQSTSYNAWVYLDDEEGVLRLGLRGRAKIHAAPWTIGKRLWRLINQTLNFTL